MRAMRALPIPRLRRRATTRALYTSSVTSVKTGKQVGKNKRRAGNVVIALLVGMLAMVAGVGTANASIIDDLGLTLCKSVSGEGVAIGSLRANSAMGGTGFLIAATTTDSSKDISMTPYEKYGTAGAVLTSVSLDEKTCSISNSNYTMVANFVFTGTKAVLAFTTLAYSQATNSAAYQVTETAVLNMITGSGDEKGLRDLIFFPFVTIALSIGSLYLGWVGLIKKASIQAAQAFVWMFGVLLASSLLMYNPGMVTQFATGFVTAGTHAISGAGSSVGGGFYTYICATPDDAAKGKTVSADADAADRTMMCKMWETLVLEPYVQMQFGGEEDPKIANQSTSVEVGNKKITNSLALKQIDNTTVGPFTAEETVAQKQAAFDEQVKNIRADDTVKSTWGSDWAGDNGPTRIWIAIMSFIGALFACGFIVWISLKIIMAEFETLLYVLIAPIVLVFGIMPQSKGIAIGWAEGLANNLMKRFMLALQIGLLMVLVSVVFKTSNDYVVAMFILGIMSVVFFKFSDTMVNMVKIRLNGAAAFGAGGQGGAIPGRAGAAGVAGATGAAAGFLAGGLSGMAMGAIKGTSSAVMTNSRGVGGGVSHGLSAGRVVKARTAQNRVSQARESSHRAKATAASNLRRDDAASTTEKGHSVSDGRMPAQNESMERSANAQKDLDNNQRVTDYAQAFEREERNAAPGKESEWSRRFTQKNGFKPPRPESLPKGVSGYDYKPESGSAPTREVPKDSAPVKDNSRAGAARNAAAKQAREAAVTESRNFSAGAKSPVNPDPKAARSFPTMPVSRPTPPAKPGQK